MIDNSDYWLSFELDDECNLEELFGHELQIKHNLNKEVKTNDIHNDSSRTCDGIYNTNMDRTFYNLQCSKFSVDAPTAERNSEDS